ncbi:MAG: serine/threonine protein phosphatase [Deltaproteobacteria bacterium]|nr:serine/threonine protein phosphatase [Deltaproteobacteria bacterium]
MSDVGAFDAGTVRMDVIEVRGPVAVIGDIHGRADLLARLLAQLGDMPVFVVGDVCDRGPDTREVIELLLARGARGVRGNHEDWFCQFVDGRGFDRVALSAMFGGLATLRSYGIESRSPREIEAQRFKVPLSHREWLSALPVVMRLLVDGARYWIAHAGVPLSLAVGIDPVRRMREVLPEHHCDLRWSALDPDNMDVLDGPVIYGHVPGKEPVDAGHAIGIDTGAGRHDGALTAVVLPARRFVTVRAEQ